MYIKSYEAKRFAGLKDVNIEFEDGLNVILGRNESGKSTIVDGIYSTLFKNIRLRKSYNPDIDFDFRYMPKPDGDSIDGKVTIKDDDGKHAIYRKWGSSEDIEFIDSDGNMFKDEKMIDNELLKLLGYGESTYNNIVFSKQSDLKKALENIVENSEVTDEISDLLRRTMMELEGISIDKLQKDIEEEIEEQYYRWDREKNYPQNNKGMNDPYKNPGKKILKSYYDKEQLLIDMEKVQRDESRFETICDEIKVLEEAIKPLEEKKNELEKIEDDVNDRAVVELQVDTLNKELKRLSDINRNWPRIEELLKQYNEKIEDFKERKKELKEEEKNIENEKIKGELEEKIKNIQKIDKDINSLKDKLKTIPEIDEESIERLSELQNEKIRIETTIEASKMIASLKKQGEEEVYIKRDFEEAEKLELDKSLEANGLINIKYGDIFELEIKTGEIDFEELDGEYKKVKEDYKELLEDLKISSIEEGRENLRDFQELKTNKKSLGDKRSVYLDKTSKEELQEKVEEFKDIKVYRSLEEIEKSILELEDEELKIRSNKAMESEKMENWEKEYENHDKLFDSIVDKKIELKEEDKRLEDLKPLPEEFEDSKEFRESLNSIKKILDENKRELETLRPDYHDAKNNLSDISYEELQKESIEAEKTYLSNVTRGQKLLEIQRVFLDTKEKLSDDPMETLVNEFARLLDTITDGDYKQSNIDESFNIRLENKNGQIPIELLSAGTYDSVTLALRFALLKHIFQDEDGYVVLDDCLVDLDPKRKRESVRLINEFANDYQIIFTTCDPETANMLGGNLIEL